MNEPKVVTKDEWLEARVALLEEEKAFTRRRDELSKKRRELPWVLVDKAYTFQGPSGEETLADQFDGRRQLLLYHFMFGPDWEAGCPACSLLTDHFQGAIPHLAQRNVSFVAVSRTSLENIEAYKARMGWNHKWVSSLGSDFNFDFNVSFSEEEKASETAFYNYKSGGFPSTEGPGLSVFKKGDDGKVYHTYSSYGRGLDIFIGAYNYLDVVPLGRDEDDLPYPMAWVKRRDEY